MHLRFKHYSYLTNNAIFVMLIQMHCAQLGKLNLFLIMFWLQTYSTDTLKSKEQVVEDLINKFLDFLS
jgi:hypothetical protein